MIEFVDTPARLAPRLRRIVCGVNGTSEGREALRQAGQLAGQRKLEIVSVSRTAGLTPADNDAAILKDAERTARALCVDAVSRAMPAATAAAGLIRAAAGADLLVIGCDALGPTPKAVLRRGPCSLLLARRPIDLALCDMILIEDDAPPRVRLAAAQLAAEHGSELHTVAARTIVAAAEATGCGLIVVEDNAMAAQVARLAPCSVLVYRGRS